MAHKTKPKTDLAQLSIRQLRNLRRRVSRQFPDVERVISGSLQNQRRRCGKEGCRCTRGELHGPYRYLSVKAGKHAQLVDDKIGEKESRLSGDGSRIMGWGREQTN